MQLTGHPNGILDWVVITVLQNQAVVYPGTSHGCAEMMDTIWFDPFLTEFVIASLIQDRDPVP